MSNSIKICPQCRMSKITNTKFNTCYECYKFNHPKETETDEESDQPILKREQLPKTVRNALWINYYDDRRIGMCQCCRREQISIGNFQAGHIVAHANGGKTTLDNLVPICTLCNLSMGTHNLNEFIKKYNLHYRPEINSKIDFSEDSD